VTVSESAWCAGCDVSTICRWLGGDHLPVRPEDRPWEADAVPVDDSLGRRYRRIAVSGINPSFWKTRAMRERLALTLATWPSAQGWCIDGKPGPRCTAPLAIAGKSVPPRGDCRGSR
jgi:hypothetical protein